MSRPFIPLELRFWSKVKKTRNCWLWTASRLSDGYGKIGAGKSGGWELAHRASYRLSFGKIPQGKHILHKCDNPPCVRPSHLFVGDQRTNIQDMMNKGRQRPATKLAPKEVRAIRKMKGRPLREIAEAFGVSASHVCNLLNNKSRVMQ